jgi:hypothetical protein
MPYETWTVTSNMVVQGLITAQGGITQTGQDLLANGTVTLPALSFASDPDSGMYRIAANNIGIGVNAAKVLDIGTGGLGVVGVVLNGNGTVSLPAFSFTSDPDSGIYRIGANNIGVAVNAAKVLDVGTAGLGVTGTLSASLAFTPTGGVAAAGGFSASPRNMNVGGAPAMAAADGSDATPVNTEVYIGEVFVGANVTVTGVAILNGSVASGNVKVGLANSAGAVVATSASTAMAGTDAYQRVPFTGTYAAVGPATYYVLYIVDNSTARYNAWPLGNFGAAKQTGQVFATGFTTITPPTTFTADLTPIAGLY